jgi:hypothetical protein
MIIAGNPPIDLPVEELNNDQKWKLFQYLWKDVVDAHEAEIEPPAWHEEVLSERLEKIESEKAVWQDLDEAMDDLRKQLT